MRYTLGLGAAALWPALARAQETRRVELWAGGIVATAASRVLTDARETWSGLWLGGTVGAQRGRVSVSMTGFRGRLGPVDDATAVERDEGRFETRVGFEPRSWLGLEATYTIRASNSAAGYQRWNLLGAGARFSWTLGDSAVRAFVGGSLLPIVSAGLDPAPQRGLRAQAGVSANLDAWTIGRQYSFVRYSFARESAVRLEEFDWIALQVSYHVRLPGARTRDRLDRP